MRRASSVAIVVAVCAAACPLPAQRQDQPRGQQRGLTASEDIKIPSDQEGREELGLTLRDALRIGRLNNLSLKVNTLAPFQLAEGVRIEEAFFEPEFFAGIDYSDADNAPRNIFQPSIKRETLSTNLGFRQQLVTGALYSISMTPVRLRQTTDVAGFPEQLNTNDITLRVTQPLLRGAWTDQSLAGVRTAEANLASGRSRFERQVQDTLLAIVRAYWELKYAREDYRVVYQSLELAREQLRITNERIRVRELAERDRVSDEADVARREEALIRADNEIRLREDLLRQLLFDDRDGQLWERNLRPVSPIEGDFRTPDIDWREAARTALRLRPDIAALRSDVRAAEIAFDSAERNVLPQLDLVGSAGSETVQNSSSDALRDVFNLGFPSWSVGLQFVMPIGNNAARGARDQAMLALEAARRTLYAAEVDVTREVREALRDLATFSESIRAGTESVRLAATTLETEQERLRVGRGTAFEVQQRNQELLEARERLLRNQLDYRTSESRLLYVQGVLQAPGSSASATGDR